MNKFSTSLPGLARGLYVGLLLFFSIFFLLKTLRERKPAYQLLRLRERAGE